MAFSFCSSNRDDLGHGIEHAKTVQVATVDQGSLAKQSKVTILPSFLNIVGAV